MSTTDLHVIASDGEVDLVLPHPEQLVTYMDEKLELIPTAPRLASRPSNAEQAFCSAKSVIHSRMGPWKPETLVHAKISPETEPGSEQSDADPETPASTSPEEYTASNSEEDCVRIRVSFKHLALSSSYFKRNLKSGMLESHTLSAEGRVDLVMKDADSDAMLIVMNIVHARTRQVPRRVNFDMLMRIAILVDYLECHEAIEPFSDIWIDEFKSSIATTYSKELIQWLCLSLVFHKESYFTAMTEIAIRQARGPIQTLGLPIRESVVGKINLHRNYALDQLFSAFETLLDHFRQDRAVACNSMLYGTLVTELSCRGLLFPRPQIPFIGHSFENIAASVGEIQNPQWANKECRSMRLSYYELHTCQLKSHIAWIITHIDSNLRGLSLSEFV